MPNPKTKSLSYRDAGVDIDAGDALVEAIKPIAKRTRRTGCLDALGGFGAMFEIPGKFKEPVLVSGTDGVGTKLKLAITADRHDTIGIDLVAMCVNDIIVQGAEPLFFLDYFATGRLEPATATAVITGIGRGCELAGAALIGGETAEMPGMYAAGDYDLAGFCVGAVEKSAIIDGRDVRPGDQIIGLTSSGPHSNGYSLIRKIVAESNAAWDDDFQGRPLVDVLLEPTVIYVKSLLALMQDVRVRALAHITGGGIPGNLVRVLRPGAQAVIDSRSWRRAAIFDWLQEHGGVADDEMYRTFNCGIGMIMIVGAEDVDRSLAILTEQRQPASVIGEIRAHTGDDHVVIT